MSTTIVIILVIVFLIYWIVIKDGQFKEGLGKFTKGDYSGSVQHFSKAIIKNSNHKKANYYIGMAYKHLADSEKRDRELYLRYAVENLIRASNGIYNGRANNDVEIIIVSETDSEIQRRLIIVAKNQIQKVNPDLMENYFWLDKI